MLETDLAYCPRNEMSSTTQMMRFYFTNLPSLRVPDKLYNELYFVFFNIKFYSLNVISLYNNDSDSRTHKNSTENLLHLHLLVIYRYLKNYPQS